MKRLIRLTLTFSLMILVFACFGQEVETEVKKSAIQTGWQFLSDNWGWIASVLFIVSEALASSKMKSNSIYQLLMGWLKRKATKLA